MSIRTAGRQTRVAVQISALCAGFVLFISIAAIMVNAKGPEKFKSFNLKTLEGEKKSLQDYANKTTLVGFFYPNCPFCNVALPEEQKLYEKYKDKGLSVVWINVLPEEKKLIPAFMEKHNLTVPVLVGASQPSLMRDYDLVATPTDYLLGANGEVLYHHSGYKAGDEKILEDKILQALKIAQ